MMPESHLPILLPERDRDLLLECEVMTFRSSGKGGQNVNKVETGVRIVHRPTGIVVTSQTERSQYRNKMECLQKLRARVEKLNYRKPHRVATKTPPGARAKRRETKVKTSEKKKVRTQSRRIRSDD
jgi:ribosome-associated protein